MKRSRFKQWYRKSKREKDLEKRRDSDESASDSSSEDSPKHQRRKASEALKHLSGDETTSDNDSCRSRSPLANEEVENKDGSSHHSGSLRSIAQDNSRSESRQSNASSLENETNDSHGGGGEERIRDGNGDMLSNEGSDDDIDFAVQQEHMEGAGEQPAGPARANSVSSQSHESTDAESISGDSDQTDSDGESLQGEEDDKDNHPIFNGSSITFRESLLAILTFVLSHKLTGQCLSDLLALIALHCGANSICVKTLYKFKTYFKMIGKNVIICHFYCSVCEMPLENKDSICQICHGQHEVAYFIEFPIVNQLLKLYSRTGFYESLRFKTDRVKKNRENIEDIYDALIYKQLVESGFLSNPENISFFMYFDGISLFKSSHFSIWPIYLSINELKYTQRTKKENVILAGIWFGKSKPNPNLFLQPLHSALSSLEENGINVDLPNGQNVRVRAKLIGGVGDMPAKSTFQRFIQYNGAFSCFYCMAQGGRYDLGKTTVQVFPYSRNIELRKNEDVPDLASQALLAREKDPDASVFGVKGPSLLWSMLPNMILCMGIDIMHGVFLNVMRTLLNLWFNPQFSELPFCISAFVKIVDDRLKAIKPPSSFKVPRGIFKELALMKASDLKNFFCYYSLPVLLGILPERYWYHHYKLVTAIALLSQESISMNQINQAEELLHLYVSEFEALYDLRYLSLSFHQLLHLPLVVRHLGPTWVYSCFFYESLNGELARLVHGSRHAAMQICSSCSVYMNLSVMISKLKDGSEAKNLCLKLLGRSKQQFKITDNIDYQTDVVGKMTVCVPLPALFTEILRDSYNIDGGRFITFQRLKKKGTVYATETYERSTQKINCFVELSEGETRFLAKIKMFVKWSSCDEQCDLACDQCDKRYFCVVSLYERIPWEVHDAPNHPLVLPYLDRVSSKNEVRIFPVNSIKSVGLYMCVDEKDYIALPVNSLEVE